MSTQTQTTTTYTVDPSHSSLEFTVRHLMISKVRGRFGAFSGTIEADAEGMPTGVDVTIDATSIDTRETQRDAHLKSADFFEVEKYPTITFVSKNITGNPERFQATGDFTLHGVTREIVVVGELDGRGGDPWGNQRVAYSASTKINRKDFGLNWNTALETGGVMVSDEVKIELNVEATAQK